MSLNKKEWDVVSKTVSAQRQNERVQQQAIYRLFEALETNNQSMVQKLIENTTPLDFPLFFSSSDPLHAPKVVRDSVVPGADNFKPIDYPFGHITPMGWAAWRDDVDMLDYLERLGADPHFPGADGRDAMWMALWNDAIHAWDWFCDRSPNWALRTADGKRTTRLIDAVRRRSVHAVRTLVNHVDVSAFDMTGRTALHYNFLQNPYTDADAQIARLLVEYGAPVNSEDHEGVTPAALAQTPEQMAAVQMAELTIISEQAREAAARQRAHLEAQSPTPKPDDPSDPGFPQIQKPVQFKKRIM